jgi:hypothetical protein
MIEDVSQVMTKHITNILSGVIGEYTIYKETHDTIMGLPCVRKLQQQIIELEKGKGGEQSTTASTPNSREDEIAQLQSAIVDLNRYIHALERSNNAKKAVDAASDSTQNETNREEEEESVKLEIHENDNGDVNDDEQHDDSCVNSSSVRKTENVIVSSDELLEAEDEDAEDAEEEEAEEEEAEEADAEEEEADAEVEEVEEEEEADAEEEEVEEAEEAEADAEEDEADAEAEEAEADTEEKAEEADAEEDAEEEEEAEEADAEEEEAEEDAEEEAEEDAEEAEIEVSEVKIKGKTYFTTDAVNGIIYACVDDDVGDEVGVFKNGVAVFNKGKK